MNSKTNLSLIALMLFILPFAGKAQDNSHTFEAGPRAKTVFVEIGGPGFISANYDFRFGETRNAWGMRAGLGYFAVDGESFFTVPVQVNYLLGRGGNYFEIGGGASFLSLGYTEFSYDGWGNSMHEEKINETQIMGSMTFGYRKQPIDGGFNFRAGLSPVFWKGNFIPYLGYLSFGYSF
ncbi:MAG TPA: hypothetical protein VKZ78_08240 [Sphingobacteriaceae bacterium]|nr:hypothetical protein [Sphingobacteriaceae bacterium]